VIYLDSIQVNHGLSRDMNKGFGGDNVWLVPVWTKKPSEGVTSIEVIAQKEKIKGYADVANGARGDFRYLKMVRDPSSRKKITQIKLFRTDRENSKPTASGYSFYGGDIKKYRKGYYYLYLCWKETEF